MDDVKVTTVKGFLNGNEYAKKGTALTVPELRARELEGNKLVVRDQKKAPDTQNKMAATPDNKVASTKAGKAK